MDLEFDDDDEPLRESGPPTPEELEALRKIFLEQGVEIPDPSALTVVREHTSDSLRAEAEAIAERFQRGDT